MEPNLWTYNAIIKAHCQAKSMGTAFQVLYPWPRTLTQKMSVDDDGFNLFKVPGILYSLVLCSAPTTLYYAYGVSVGVRKPLLGIINLVFKTYVQQLQSIYPSQRSCGVMISQPQTLEVYRSTYCKLRTLLE